MFLTKYLWGMLVILGLSLLAACDSGNSQKASEEYSPPKYEQRDREEGQQNIAKENTTEGDCANFDFSHYYTRDGKLDLSRFKLRVLRDNAKLYKTETAQNPDKSKLAFSTSLVALSGEVDGERIQVANLNDEPLGWVSRKDLLCANRPLKDPSKGLEKKFYIKTEIQPRKEDEAVVTAYPIPKKQCNGKCEQLSRFSMYFIVDQEDDWYLLAYDYHIRQNLIGWVQKSDGFIWDTAYGLRPRDDLKSRDEPGDGTVCVYMNLDDAKNESNCRAIVKGGKDWYKFSSRLPLLDIVDSDGKHLPPEDIAEEEKHNGKKAFYKVVASMPGVGVSESSDTQFTITPEQLGEPDLESVLAPLKFVDVLFLIDGTESMQPFINMIRGQNGEPGIVQQLADTLRRNPQFKDSKTRFGFRIFRDDYAGNDGIGEGLSLPSQHCDNPSEDYLNENISEFEKKIAGIKASDDDKDDYPENLFGGLKWVLNKDSRYCPGHFKLLFVIGDHGYDETARLQRGSSVLSMKKLKKIIHDRKAENKSGWGVFFIQTPNYKANSNAYDSAYQSYCIQGHNILKELNGTDEKTKKYFIRLQSETSTNSNASLCGNKQKPTQVRVSKLGEYILEQVKGFYRGSAAISPLIVSLRGGKGLETAIK